MDPKACLIAARDAVNDHDYETAHDHLCDYRDWRSAGGFDPGFAQRGDLESPGDAIASMLAHVCFLHGFGVE